MNARVKFSVELQSMRGCAALLVLLGHCYETYLLKNSWLEDLLSAVLNGRGAVTFFFVLSGAVIALSLTKFQWSAGSYMTYAIRRLFRILPLILVASILGTIFCNHIDSKAHYSFATEWFTECYKEKVDVSRFIASLIGYSARPDPPLWSIFVELVGSAFIPLMVLAGRNRAAMVLTAVFLAIVSFLPLNGFKYNWPVFMITFFVGVTLVNWGRIFTEAVLNVKGAALSIALVCGLVFFLNRQFIWISSGHGDPVTNIIEIIAVAPLIAMLLYTPDGFSPLRARPLAGLGDISFSLYVLHFPILGLVVQGMASVFSQKLMAAHPIQFMLLTMVIVTTASILLSQITYRYIELPFANLGKTVSTWKWSGAALKAT